MQILYLGRMSRAKHSATQTFISRLEHIRRNHQLAEIQKREQAQQEQNDRVQEKEYERRNHQQAKIDTGEMNSFQRNNVFNLFRLAKSSTKPGGKGYKSVTKRRRGRKSNTVKRKLKR